MLGIMCVCFITPIGQMDIYNKTKQKKKTLQLRYPLNFLKYEHDWSYTIDMGKQVKTILLKVDKVVMIQGKKQVIATVTTEALAVGKD